MSCKEFKALDKTAAWNCRDSVTRIPLVSVLVLGIFFWIPSRLLDAKEWSCLEFESSATAAAELLLAELLRPPLASELGTGAAAVKAADMITEQTPLVLVLSISCSDMQDGNEIEEIGRIKHFDLDQFIFVSFSFRNFCCSGPVLQVNSLVVYTVLT